VVRAYPMTPLSDFFAGVVQGTSLPYVLLLGVLALMLIENVVLIVMEARRRNVRAKRRAQSPAAMPIPQSVAEPVVPRPVMKVTKHRCKIDGEMFVHVFDVELLTEAAPERVTVEADAALTYAISMGAVGDKFEGQTEIGGALPIMTIDNPARRFQVNVWSRNGVQVPEIAARVE